MVQFVYWGSQAEIWYIALNYGDVCPTGWTAKPDKAGNCFQLAPNVFPVKQQPISNLVNMTLTAIHGSTTDTVVVTTGDDNLYSATNTSLVSLTGQWSQAEFNVFGNGTSEVATFSPGTTLAVQVLTNNSNSGAPSCASGGTTGEKNNLLYVPSSCCGMSGETPGILFTESNANNPVAYPCPQAPTFRIQSRWVTTEYAEEVNGALQYGPWADSDSQEWQLQLTNDGFINIFNVATGHVVSVQNQLAYAECLPYNAGSWSGEWSVHRTSDGYYQFQNRSTEDESMSLTKRDTSSAGLGILLIGARIGLCACCAREIPD